MNNAIQIIYDSIALCGFSVDTLKLIDNYNRYTKWNRKLS